jgi:hypothetical protein
MPAIRGQEVRNQSDGVPTACERSSAALGYAQLKEITDLRSQIKLGRFFGIEIGLHYSWFLIALLIVLSLSSQFRGSNPEWGDGVILVLAVATSLLFFVSLLLHELAHSLVATSNNLPVKEITCSPWAAFLRLRKTRPARNSSSGWRSSGR